MLDACGSACPRGLCSNPTISSLPEVPLIPNVSPRQFVRFFFGRFTFRRLVFLLRPRTCTTFAQIPAYAPVFFERICGSECDGGHSTHHFCDGGHSTHPLGVLWQDVLARRPDFY